MVNRFTSNLPPARARRSSSLLNCSLNDVAGAFLLNDQMTKQQIRSRRWYLKNRKLAAMRSKIWFEKNRKQKLLLDKLWHSRNPQHRKAYNALHNSIRSGAISKPSACQQCGSTAKIQAHHQDYTKPLDVQWLCVKCHLAEHGKQTVS